MPSPEKAYYMGIDHKQIRISTWKGKYGGNWVAYLPDPNRGRYVLTEGNAYSVCRWVAQLRTLWEGEMEFVTKARRTFTG